MTERICGACGSPQPDDDPRRRWCSPRCRRLVHRFAGPLALAGTLEGYAENWEALAHVRELGSTQIAEALATAETLRAQVDALRSP